MGEAIVLFAAVAARSIAVIVASAAVVVAVGSMLAGRRAARRQRAAERLLERRLDLALEAGGMTTWLWHAEEDRMSWDERAAGVYGAEPPTAPADWLLTVHPDDRERVEAEIEERTAARDRFHLVHRLDHPAGELRWLDLRGEPVLDEGGHLLGTAGVVVDVTVERLAAAELAASREALERILEVSPVFAVEDNPDEVPGRICAAAREIFACSAAGIWTLDGDRVLPVALHPVPRSAPAFRRTDFPHLRRLLERQGPVHVSSADARDPVARRLMTGAGMVDGVLAPLGMPTGERFLTLWWDRDHDRPGLAQLAEIRRFADQAALAMALASGRSARDEVDRLNETLQAGLLPGPAVADPGVRIDARYRPGERRMLLGGDFYDAVEQPDGAIAFVVGDVIGHGAGPAAVGTALRSAWRAMALAGNDPTAWLRGLGTVLASYATGPETLVTVCTGRIEPDRSAVVLSNAGHPPPILLTGARAEPIDLPSGIALGVTAPGEGAVTTAISLEAGWRLLLYTDGAIEVRTGGRSTERIGEEGLAAWLEEQAPRLAGDALLDALIAHLERSNEAPIADDVAVVLIGPR